MLAGYNLSIPVIEKKLPGFLFLDKKAVSHLEAFQKLAVLKDLMKLPIKLLQSRSKYFELIMKSSKVRQDQKTLISVLAHFLNASAKILFLQGRLETRPCTHAV